jgi:hypothetical protein
MHIEVSAEQKHAGLAFRFTAAFLLRSFLLWVGLMLRLRVPWEYETVKKESSIAGGSLDGFDGAVETKRKLRICGVGRRRDYEENSVAGRQARMVFSLIVRL